MIDSANPDLRHYISGIDPKRLRNEAGAGIPKRDSIAAVPESQVGGDKLGQDEPDGFGEDRRFEDKS